MDKSKFHGPRDYLDAAQAADASPDDLRGLAGSEYVFVRLAVAENPATAAETLDSLMPKSPQTLNDRLLVHRIAEHPNTPLATLLRIADVVPGLLDHRDDYHGFGAGVALTRRTDVPLETLLAMVDDERATTQFRKVVARETTRPEIIDHLVADRSERVRRAALNRT